MFIVKEENLSKERKTYVGKDVVLKDDVVVERFDGRLRQIHSRGEVISFEEAHDLGVVKKAKREDDDTIVPKSKKPESKDGPVSKKLETK